MLNFLTSETSTKTSVRFRPPTTTRPRPDDSFTHAGTPLCCSVTVNVAATSAKQTMWSKISNVLKTRTDDDQVASSSATVPHSLVVEKIREQHPNMSMFQPSSQDITLPVPSPPSSPTKNGRLGLFKRNTKPHHENASSVSLAKKVKSSLHINTNMNGE